MNYDLAKQLKDAGFPQGEDTEQIFKKGVALAYLRESKPSDDLFKKYDKALNKLKELYKDDEEYVYVPTLEELIKAIVGDRRNTFSLHYDEEWGLYEPINEDGPWSARYYDRTPVGFYENGAKTPIEAVANLWLALNKK